MRVAEVKRLVEAHGSRNFIYKLIEMLTTKKLRPDDVSIRGLWEALVGPVEDTLGGAHQDGGRLRYVLPDGFGRSEEVQSSTFPIAVGALIAAKVIDAYNQQRYVGDQLVTLYPSKLKVDTIPGFGAAEGSLDVDEGEDYKDSSMSEKFITITAKKRGRIISITEEMIMFDQTGLILQRAEMIAEKLRLNKERRILRGITDADGTVWKPSNVATAVYSTGNKNLIATNALVDWQNIDTCQKQVALQTDEQSDEVLISPDQLLVPRALWGTAMRITQATQVRQQSQVNDPQVATYSPAPFSGMFSPIVSALLDALSTTSWYMGEFKRAFWYKEILPLQTLAAKEGNEDDFNRDIKFKYKVREYGDVGCIDPRYVYKNTA